MKANGTGKAPCPEEPHGTWGSSFPAGLAGCVAPCMPHIRNSLERNFFRRGRRMWTCLRVPVNIPENAPGTKPSEGRLVAKLESSASRSQRLCQAGAGENAGRISAGLVTEKKCVGSPDAATEMPHEAAVPFSPGDGCYCLPKKIIFSGGRRSGTVTLRISPAFQDGVTYKPQ